MALTDFAAWAKAATERIANNARALAVDAGRPVISFEHVKSQNRAGQKEEAARQIATSEGITEGIVFN